MPKAIGTLCRYFGQKTMHFRTGTYLGTLLVVFVALTQQATAEHLQAERRADVIRVSVMDHLSLEKVRITPRAAGLSLRSEATSWSIEEGKAVYLENRGAFIVVLLGSERIEAAALVLEPEGPGAMDVVSVGSSDERTYTGSLEAVPKEDGAGMTLVNLVPIEDYVASVVGSEYGLDDIEGAKAMAVVARTYALNAMQQQRPLVDSDRSQVYLGLQRATAATRLAAAATAGEVLTWNGSMIDAVYSASNGGRTASNESIWATSALPYLTSRKDPFDAQVSPHASWQFEIDEKRLEQTVSETFGIETRAIRVDARAPDGRVTRVLLKGKQGSKTVSGSAFRAALARSFGAMSVRSTYFELKEKRRRYVLKGQGFGHGVGLSQWGAHGMARAGRSYEDILAFYYSGTQLARFSPNTKPSEHYMLAQAEPREPTRPLASWTSEEAVNPENTGVSDPGTEAADEAVGTSLNDKAPSRSSKKKASRRRRVGW